MQTLVDTTSKPLNKNIRKKSFFICFDAYCDFMFYAEFVIYDTA